MRQQKDSFFTRPVVVCLFALFSCALWGSAFPGIKTGYALLQIPEDAYQTQILFAGSRFFLAGLLTILFGSMAQRKLLFPGKGSLKRIGILSVFQTILQYIPFYIGLAHTSGVKASILIGTNVFLSLLFACLLFRQEALTRKKIWGSILGFLGVVLVNLSGTGLSMEFSFLGEGMILFSSVSSAFSAVLMKQFSRFDHPVLLSGYQFLVGGLVLAVCGFAAGGRILYWTPPGAGILFYLAFLSAAAYSIWSILLKYNPVSRVTVFGFMKPVFGVILSAVILNEGQQAFGQNTFAALILVSLGIYTVNSAAKAAD